MTMKFGMILTGAALLLACGGGRDSALAVEPGSPTVMVGETLSISARSQADAAGEVNWEVQEMYGGGLLQSQGPRVTYVAPEAAGTYHLVLRTEGRASRQVIAIRVVPSPSMEPAAPRLQPMSTVLFTARMKGLSRDTVTWEVEEADGGEISAEGRYTAPRKPGLYHVTATSTLDPSACARALVTVGEN